MAANIDTTQKADVCLESSWHRAILAQRAGSGKRADDSCYLNKLRELTVANSMTDIVDCSSAPLMPQAKSNRSHIVPNPVNTSPFADSAHRVALGSG